MTGKFLFAWDSSGKLDLAFTISCNCSSYRLQGEEVGDNEGKAADRGWSGGRGKSFRTSARHAMQVANWKGGGMNEGGTLQGLAKECSLGCVNSRTAARGSKEAGFAQPRDHSLADPCRVCIMH